ncbi:hypothetical protein HDV00_002192 [Rhizophlyctis rosea]|nr:hypothetical protein HDV00_002192 [Rhizophlyctis rosea]
MVFAFLKRLFRRKNRKAPREANTPAVVSSFRFSILNFIRRHACTGASTITPRQHNLQRHPRSTRHRRRRSLPQCLARLAQNLHKLTDPTITIKHIKIVRRHTWATSHPEYTANANCIVRYLYHGTPSRNVRSITEKGFRSNETYMATHPSISVPYSMKESYKSYHKLRRRTEGAMILSCVLMEFGEDLFTPEFSEYGSVAVVRNKRRIVPVAVITFEHQTY